jgi:hypothetical protein
MLNNEEEIRSKLILPFISDLGFDINDISLEQYYSIKLGKKEKQMGGKSDLLCKKNDQNLFVVEIKRDKHKITEADINQAISYSRALVGNIAPFTIVTNGKTIRIFDTITKEDLSGKPISTQSEYWKNGCKLSLDEDLNIRYQALLSFVSFSNDNFKIFSKEQIKDNLKLVSGDIDSPRAKFIESLHVQRINLKQDFEEFQKSDKSVFGLVGDAGVGKTCSMCSLAIESSKDHFTFFYNGTLISQPIIDEISQDLNLFFSTKIEREKVLNKLQELATQAKKNVIIFIDAIDENISTFFPNELSGLTNSVSKFDKLKICISCKTTVWDRFLTRNETNNNTFHELTQFHGNNKEQNYPGFYLETFDQNESNDIVPLYRKAFNFKGEISNELEEKLKNGFFLRIFSEVYRNREVPKNISDLELIKTYLSKSLKIAFVDIQDGLRYLSELGKAILKHDKSTFPFIKAEGLNVEVAINEIQLPLGNKIPQELFDRNILIKSGDDVSYQISFYYSSIRDYIICYHSYQLDKLGDDQFNETLEKFHENQVGQSAINFYLNNADLSKKNIYDRFKKAKLISYAKSYNQYLDKYYGILKKKFNPYTEGKIGIIIPENFELKDGYSLCPINDDTVKSFKTDNFNDDFNTPFYKSSIYKKGGRTIHFSSDQLLVRDQNEIIEKYCFQQLKKIIEDGELVEYGSNIILIEKVVTILYYNYKELKYDYTIDDFRLPRFNQVYPLNLIDLRDRLYKFRAEHYYKRNKIEKSQISKMVDFALNRKEEIPPLNVTGSFPPFEELYKIVNILIDRGITKLDSHYLPTSDISLKEIKDKFYRKSGVKNETIRIAQFSVERMKEYITTLFTHVEIAYKELVESCFIHFLKDLNYYNNMPHHFYIYLNEENEFYGCYGKKSSDNSQFKVEFKRRDKENSKLKEDGISWYRIYYLDKFLNVQNSIQTVPGFAMEKVNENCIIRNLVYDILIQDFNLIFKKHDIRIQRRHYV